jgi:hypothetical protein
VTTLQELIDCVDCVTEFKVDCADRGGAGLRRSVPRGVQRRRARSDCDAYARRRSHADHDRDAGAQYLYRPGHPVR